MQRRYVDTASWYRVHPPPGPSGSGILAAATAGVSMHYADLIGRPLAATRTQRKAVWDTVQLVLNGVIFVMLGAQLPTTVAGLPAASMEVGAGSAWKLPLFVIAITVGLTFMRFIWVFISMKLTLFKHHKNVAGESKEAALLATVEYRQSIAEALQDGIDAYSAELSHSILSKPSPSKPPVVSTKQAATGSPT